LIYFPPQVPLSQLLPDGTDTLHTPGEPFDRRLWAGGRVQFADSELLLDGRRAVCIESIRNVAVKGREGDEKVIVTVERRVGTVPEEEAAEKTWERIWKTNANDPGESAVVENRDLIFMRPKSEAQLQHDQEQFGATSRIVKRENTCRVIQTKPAD
jgi:hydroxyacyl-ACP dehydratase HTD2-like protein with hotdog domain